MPAPIVLVPAGVSAAGLASPVEFVSPAKPPAVLADNIDPSTGELLSILSGIHPVDSHVITRLRTQRASGVSVMNVGHEFAQIRKVDDAFVKRVTNAVENLFADLIERGDIKLPKVAVVEDGDTGHVWFQYINMRTQRRRKKPNDGTDIEFDIQRVRIDSSLGDIL
jgi:hypothetical protein